MTTTMEINPSSLANRADSAGPRGGTPGPSHRPPPIITNGLKSSSSGTAAAAKATQTLPRVDIEPIYTALKASVGEHWAAYKDAVSRFVLGFLNQDELCRATQHFIAVDPAREHLHNQLVCAILANVVRDAPEPGVASWVSANDKPASVAKPVTGNAAEQRLKHEVMQLPPRFRHRIKSVKDEPRQPIRHSMKLANELRQLPRPRDSTPPPSSSAQSATASTGLNKDLEIRRHYNAPLISEARDLPSSAVLADRILPICYEEGLASGASPAPLIGELLGTALEFFVKESLASMLGPTRTDAPLSDPTAANPAPTAAAAANGSTAAAPTAPIPPTSTRESLPDGAAASAEGIRTATFKKKVAREEAAARRGELKRNEAGLLPTEAAAQRAQAQGRGLPGDLRVSWDLGDAWLTSLMPWHGERLLVHDEMEYMNMDEDETATEDHGRVGGLRLPRTESPSLVNGDAKMSGQGQDEPPDDMMAIDEADWGWKGGKEAERKELGSLLDECLAVGV